MHKIVIDLCLFGIAIGLTLELIKSAIPYLPLFWLVILGNLTWELIKSKYVLCYLNKIKHRLSPRGHMFSYVVIAIIGGALFCFYWWALTSFFAPKIAAYEADQRKKELNTPAEIAHPAVNMQPTFKEKVDKVYFQLGGGGITVEYDLSQLHNNKVQPFNFGGHKPINLYVENNGLYADVIIYGGIGESPIEIVHNEFVIRKPGWDKNYNREAFEVVDDKLNPIFQFIYKSKNHIIVNGIFPFDFANLKMTPLSKF